MVRGLALERGVARFCLLAQGRRALFARYADDPAHPRPTAQHLPETIGKITWCADRRSKFDTAWLEMDEMDMREEMGAQHRLPMSIEEFDDIEKALRQRYRIGGVRLLA